MMNVTWLHFAQSTKHARIVGYFSVLYFWSILPEIRGLVRPGQLTNEWACVVLKLPGRPITCHLSMFHLLLSFWYVDSAELFVSFFCVLIRCSSLTDHVRNLFLTADDDGRIKVRFFVSAPQKRCAVYKYCQFCRENDPPHFTRATLASAGVSCRRVSVYPSVRLSQVSVLLKRLPLGSRNSAAR